MNEEYKINQELIKIYSGLLDSTESILKIPSLSDEMKKNQNKQLRAYHLILNETYQKYL